MFKPLEKSTTQMTESQIATQATYIKGWLADCRYTHTQAHKALAVSRSTFSRWLYLGWSLPKRVFYAMEHIRGQEKSSQPDNIGDMLS